MHYKDRFQTKRIDNSRPPLRWFANIAGSISTYCITHAFDAQDNGKTFRSHVYVSIGSKLLKPYTKWGTMYKVKLKDEDWD